MPVRYLGHCSYSGNVREINRTQIKSSFQTTFPLFQNVVGKIIPTSQNLEVDQIQCASVSSLWRHPQVFKAQTPPVLAELQAKAGIWHSGGKLLHVSKAPPSVLKNKTKQKQRARCLCRLAPVSFHDSSKNILQYKADIPRRLKTRILTLVLGTNGMTT